ncbi:MBG domain-containing protein [Myroides sp. DW712]|uniref:MBG domain-containing protein n=1 Tax=Myroides sp. DW712 TaxID=3389800 RepID=UPI00397E3934
MNKKLLLKFFLIFMLLSGQLSKGQNYTPLVITSGFNEDVIAEDSPASTHSTAAVDATSTGANNAFMSRSYPGATVGLPNDGLITTIATSTPGLTFQLAAYDQNNSLKINANNGTGTLAIQTTQQLSKLFILVTSGSATSTFTGTITFTDATTQSFGTQSVPDWYDTGTPPVAIRGIGRVSRTGTQLPDNNTGNPKLFQVAIAIDPANQTKVVQKIDVVKTSSTNGFLNIFGVSGEIRPDCIEPGNLGVQNMTSTSADLVWVSPGTLFDIKWGARGFNVSTAGTLVTGFENGETLSGLTINTDYDFYVRRDCGAVDGVSAWAGPFQFRTGYCVPTGAANNPDEIRNFKLSNLNNNSDPSEGVSGYKDYSQTVPPARLEAGVSYIASLTSGSGSGTHGAAIWIDYNNNFVFDADEKVAVIGNTIGINATTSFPAFEVPATIPPGIYRLRVQYQHNKNGTELNPCAAFSTYAETEDYAIEILPPADCLQPSTLGIENLTAATVDLTWTSTGTLFDIIWGTEGFDVTSEGTLVTGFANGGTLSGLSIDSHYDYYVRQDCGDTGLSNWAGPFSFDSLSYCVPTVSVSNSDEIRNFTLSNLNHSSPASEGVNGYINYAYIVEPAQLEAGTSYVASLKSGAGSGTHGAAIWIDYNQNLVFDADEKVTFIGNTIAANSTVSFPAFIVPETIPPGIYRLRVQYQHNNSGEILTPCAGISTYSETEDYAIEILPPPACALPSMLGVNNTTFESADLIWTSTGTLFDIKWGISGFDVATAGTLVPGFANGGTLSGLTADTNYEYYVRRDCGADGVTDWIGPYAFRTGYCIPTGSSNNADEIRNFSLSNLNNNSATSEGVNGYTDYSTTVAPAQLEAGSSFIASLTSGSGSGNHGAAIWIDYNENLVFDADEKVAVIGNTIATNTTVDFPAFTVPVTVQPGIYRLRVQYHSGKAGADLNPCSTTSSYSETEDYAVQILPPGTCARPTELGVTNTTATSADLTWTSSGTLFDIKWGLRGFDLDTAGTLVTDFTNGGTLSGLNLDMDYDYYVRQDCGTTNGVSSWVGPYRFNTLRYCIPTGATNNGDEIRTFKLSNLNHSSPDSEGVNGYNNYAHTVAPAQLQGGVSYVASLTSGSGSGNHGAAIWIDYNQNLVFDADEKVAVIGNTIAANATVNFPAFEVPATIPPGIYRLRVQYQHNKNGTELNPCAAFSTYAETEDYAIEILPPPTCYFPANLQVVQVGKSTARVTWELPLHGNTTGVQYKVELRTSGQPGEAIGLVDTFTTTDLFFALTNLDSETDYIVYVQTICSSTDQSEWSERKTFKTLCNYPEYEFITDESDLVLCEPGTVTLEVATQGNVNWYNSRTATTPVHTGNSYTTTVSATTSLWYEVVSDDTNDFPTGPINAAAVSNSQDNWTLSWDVDFTVLQQATLKTIDVYPYQDGREGRMTIRQTGSTGSATVGTINYTTVGTGGTTVQTIPINIDLPPGTYTIEPGLPSGGLRRNTGGASYPYTSPVASITGNEYSSSYYMGYYNWIFSSRCKSAREEVVVSVAPHTVTEATVDIDAADGISLAIVSSASSFTLEYGETGFERGTGTTVSTVTSPYLFQDLAAATTYDVYIQPLPCGTLYGPVTFTTLEPTETQQITAVDLVKDYGDAAFTHGESDSGLSLSYRIEDERIVVFEDGQFRIKGAGTTQITASQEGNMIYLPAEDVTFTLTVNKAMLTITADPDQEKEYGDPDPEFTFEVEGLQYDDEPSVVEVGFSRDPGEELGNYTFVQANLYAGPNYDITFVGASFEITRARLYVTANALTKVYGDADPELTYTVTGLKFTDTAVVSGQLNRVTGENVGVYTINQGGLYLTNSNYILVYEEGQLTITPATLFIQPTVGMQKIYGAADPEFTFTASGFKFDDTAALLQGTLSRESGENVGRYAYESGSLNTPLSNYIFQINNDSKFEIKPAFITVRANENQRKMFGQADPLLTYTVEGLQRGELATQVMSGRLMRQAGEAIGLYPIEQGSLLPNTNYSIDSFVSSDFEIVSGSITGVSFVSRTFIYDGTAKSLAVQGNIPADAVVTYTNNDKINVGVYEVTAVVNYGVSYEPLTLTATLTIVKADQVIDFDAPAEVLLEDTPTLQLVATASSSLPVTFSIDYEEDREIATVSTSGATSFIRPGFVTITARQAGNENYNAAVPVSRTIEVVSKNTDIFDLIVDGVSYGKIDKEVYVMIGCDSPQTSVTIQVETLEGTLVTPSRSFVVEVPEYGQYEQIIQVQSPQGNTETYKVIIDKRIPTDKIVYQKYNNVLLVNNNKQTNTGYVFTAYQWFKNGEPVGTQQAYSAGNKYGDVLEVGATYHVELTLHNGKKITSCPIYIEAPTQSELSVYPNPVKKNQALYVNLAQEHQETIGYIIYDLKGQMIQRGKLQQGNSSLMIPSTVATGSYFLVLKTEDGQQSVQFIIRE